MAFLQQLVAFDKTLLKTTETRVTTFEGRVYVEESALASEVSKSASINGAEDSSTKENGADEKKVPAAPCRAKSFTVPRTWFIHDLDPDSDVVKILPGLTMGSQDAAASLDHLLASGVTHVINLASFVDDFFKDRLVYKTIQARDIPEFQISNHFEETNKFIDDAIQAKGVVFVHCNAGISRAGSVVTAYVMKTLRLPLDEALEFVRSKRPVVRPNAGFMQQLREYERTLNLNENAAC